MAHRIGRILITVAAVAAASPVSAQVTGQDSLRRVTAEEYHILRRQWLEARRSGLIAPSPVTYGSAVVGAPGAGRPAVPTMAVPNMRPSLPSGFDPEPCPPGIGRQERIRAGSPSRAGRVAEAVAGQESFDPCRPAPGGAGTATGYGPGYPGGVPNPYGGDGYGGPGMGPGYGGYPGLGPGYGYGSQYGGNPYGYGWPADPFNPIAPQWNNWTGVTEFYWSPWGPVPAYPYGWRSSPGEGYGFSWPGVPAGECMVVTVTAAGGLRHSIAVGLQSLGLTHPTDLDLAIDQRLSQGHAVTLPGIDGRLLRLTPGMPIEDIRVTPCAAR